MTNCILQDIFLYETLYPLVQYTCPLYIGKHISSYEAIMMSFGKPFQTNSYNFLVFTFSTLFIFPILIFSAILASTLVFGQLSHFVQLHTCFGLLATQTSCTSFGLSALSHFKSTSTGNNFQNISYE